MKSEKTKFFNKLKTYHIFLMSCLLGVIFIINSNYVNEKRAEDKLYLEKNILFNDIIHKRSLEEKGDSGTKENKNSDQVCEQGSQELRTYYKTGDLREIDLSEDDEIKCEDKDSDYMQALIYFTRKFVDKDNKDKKDNKVNKSETDKTEEEDKTKSLNEKEAELKKLQKEYDQAVKKLSDLEHSIKTINIKMVRAGKLVDGLKDEGIRWKEKIVELSKESKNLLANVIISSTVVSYFGPFTMEYRKEFLQATKEYLIKAGVYYSTKEEDPEEEAKKKEEEEKKKAEEEAKQKEEEEKKQKEEEERKKKEEEQKKKDEENPPTEEELKRREEEAAKKKEEEEKKQKEEEEKKKKEEEEKKRIEEEYKPLTEEEIEERLKPENIPEFSVQEMLSGPLEIRDWNYAGLPADELSIENAIITVKAKRWPLIIDPQMQANKWIRNYYRKEKINTYKITNKNLFN